MPDSTIPDALANDLRDLFLNSLAAIMEMPAENVRLKHAKEEIPSPRIVILMGDPKNQKLMEGTANIPVSIQYITSSDTITDEQHRAKAGVLDSWMRNIRSTKRRDTVYSRVYLHDSTNLQPTTAIRAEEREQATTVRADMLVTLIDA